MQAAKAAIAQAAKALGFSALGIAPAHSDQGSTLQDWIAEGAHADMAWMERHLDARLHPDLVLPGAQSIIMLSYEYARHDAYQEGRIARYAQGQDYHKLLAPKLADLDELLQIWGGRQRCFTDAGPISERHFAQEAGLGWIGRHGLLIRKTKGSYCVLASIITDLALPYDSPHPNHCGNCQRCIQACPTGALKEGQPCDARKCLSYWTIEAKQNIPPHLAAAAPDRLYGCDICQEACPWNKASTDKPPIDPRLLMPNWLQTLKNSELQNMSQEQFEKIFQGSPIRRAGLAKLQQSSLNRHKQAPSS